MRKLHGTNSGWAQAPQHSRWRDLSLNHGALLNLLSLCGMATYLLQSPASAKCTAGRFPAGWENAHLEHRRCCRPKTLEWISVIAIKGVRYVDTSQHTYLRTQVHTYIYLHLHLHLHTRTHTHTRAYIHTQTYTHIHSYIHTDTRAYIQTYTQIHTFTYLHTYIHTNIHTYIHTDIQTDIHT